MVGSQNEIVERLTDRVRRLGTGANGVEFPTDRDDEVGRLASAIERVAVRLRGLEQSLQRHRTLLASERERRSVLFENTEDCIVRVDVGERVRIREANSQFERVFGFEDDDPVGVPLLDCIGLADCQESDRIRDSLQRGQPDEREVRLRTGDHWREFQLRFVPVSSGDGERSPPAEWYAMCTDVTERKKREQGEQRRRELYDITTDPALDSEEKIEQLLVRGREWFDLDNGYLSEVDPDGGTYSIEEAVGDEFVDAGETISLRQTFCRRTITTDDVLGIYDAVEEGLAHDPGYAEGDITCYIGARVTVDGETYGTFCFFDDEPADRPFTHTDESLVELMAQWVSYELQRREKERVRRQRKRQLEESETLFQHAQDALFLVDGESFTVQRVNPAYEQATGLAAEAVVGKTPREILGEESGAAVEAKYRQCVDRREPLRYEEVLSIDGEPRHWGTRIAPVVVDDDVDLVVGATRDVTEQRRREQALRSLHDATRELLTIEHEQGVADLVVETAATAFDSPAAALYRYDAAANELRPVAHTGAFVGPEGATTVAVAGGDSTLWNCFATGEATAFDALDDIDVSRTPDADVAGGLVVPVGTHGVFVVASRSRTVDDHQRRLVETLAATTEAALERIESETSLRDRETELAARNRRLARQVQITDIIRGIDQSLIGAKSREEIESAVCERLVGAEDVVFAWIGSRATSDEPLAPRAWDGDDEEYLDAVSFAPDASEPAVVTAREGEPTVVDDVATQLREDPWRSHAVGCGFGSALGVPLSVADHTHGVLTVYAARADAFGDLERDVFTELGETVANSIEAVNARRALHTDSFVELTLRIEEADTPLPRIAQETGADVEYEELAARAADQSRLFFAVSNATVEAVETTLDELVTVTQFQLVASSEDEHVFEATVSGTDLPSRLVRAGGTPRSVSASGSTLEVVVDIPADTDVREFVGRLERHYGETELLSRRNVERSSRARAELVSSLLEALTERQRDVLQTAYAAGFFEWPRESTGEDVAEMLDITQPTVNRHLRHGLRGLLDQLFDPDTAVRVED